jgi:hypothetical protein
MRWSSTTHRSVDGLQCDAQSHLTRGSEGVGSPVRRANSQSMMYLKADTQGSPRPLSGTHTLLLDRLLLLMYNFGPSGQS